MDVLHLVALIFALVLFTVAAMVAGPGFNWQRAVSSGLALLTASLISW